MRTHILLERSERYKRAIVCGSPERAAWFASKLQNHQPVAKNREYHSYIGQHDGKDILVISHGIGSAGAAICFNELIDAGAENIIRIGTAGGLYDDAQIGDIVIATAAAREDGVSRLMAPIELPAMADLDLTLALRENMNGSTARTKAGIVLTSDLFYAGKLPTSLNLFSSVGAIAVEMEIATLYIVAQLKKVRAGALVVLDGNPTKQGVYDPRPERLASSIEECFKAALKTLAAI